MVYNKPEPCKCRVDESMLRHVRSLSLNHSLRYKISESNKSSLVYGENEITKGPHINKTSFFTVEKI